MFLNKLKALCVCFVPMKLYTRKGDTGNTSLIGGERVPKNHIRVECYGTVDELNSHLGLLRSQISENHIEILAQIQNRLFNLGSYLAATPDSKMILPEIQPSDIDLLELQMDEHTKLLPELKNFVLPGGCALSAQAHIARCVCRRAERLVVLLAQNQEVEILVITYLNRLSDYLFSLARMIDFELKKTEIIWNPRT